MTTKLIDARIEISNVCNYKCSFCPQGIQTRKKEFMPIFLFNKILEKVRDYEYITFSGMGEPMLHPDFLDMVRLTKIKGFKIVIITNGSLLDVETFKKLDLIGVETIRVSWYGKKEQQRNLDEIFKIKNRRTKVNITYSPEKPGGPDTVMLIEKFKNKADMLEVWRLHNWGSTFDYREVQKKQLSCDRIKRSPLQIHSDGSVVMCTVSWDGQLPLGNLKDQTLDEVFESELYKRLKRDEYKGLICENCDFRNKNKEEILLYSTANIENRVNKTSTCFEELSEKNN